MSKSLPPSTDELVGLIIKYEEGEMTTDELVDFFALLVKTGYLWHLQGSYGRTAVDLMKAGLIDDHGNVIKYPEVE